MQEEVEKYKEEHPDATDSELLEIIELLWTSFVKKPKSGMTF